MRATVYRTTGYFTRSIIMASQLRDIDLDDDEDADCEGDILINEDEDE